VVADIERIARGIQGILDVREVLTMHVGPNYILVTLCAVLGHRHTEDTETTIGQLESRIVARHPRVKRVYVKVLYADGARGRVRGVATKV